MTEADEALLLRIRKPIFEKIDNGSILTLSWPEQVVALIYSAQGVIDSGGFEYFFGNDWPEQLPYSVFADAYREIGADESAECIEAAEKLFPFPDPHRAEEARIDFMATHYQTEDSLLDRLGGRVMDNSDATFDLLARYVRAHRSEFETT